MHLKGTKHIVIVYVHVLVNVHDIRRPGRAT